MRMIGNSVPNHPVVGRVDRLDAHPRESAAVPRTIVAVAREGVEQLANDRRGRAPSRLVGPKQEIRVLGVGMMIGRTGRTPARGREPGRRTARSATRHSARHRAARRSRRRSVRR